jgi:hypothetical protein
MSRLFSSIKNLVYDKRKNKPIMISFFSSTILYYISVLWVDSTSLQGTISIIVLAIYLLTTIYICIQIAKQMKE